MDGGAGWTIGGVSLLVAIDAVVVGALVVALVAVGRGSRGLSLLRGFLLAAIGLAALAAAIPHALLAPLSGTILPWLGLAAVVFQPELRRALERIGAWRAPRRAQPEARARALVTIEALVDAATRLSAEGTGALVVVSGQDDLRAHVVSGPRLDANVSAPLLHALFAKNAPLHDGAVVLRHGRIASAGTVLPLTERPLPPGLGTRHRAAVGISERTDALALVVSEERGHVSLVRSGRIHADLDPEQLRAALEVALLAEDRRRTNRRAGDPTGIVAAISDAHHSHPHCARCAAIARHARRPATGVGAGSGDGSRGTVRPDAV